MKARDYIKAFMRFHQRQFECIEDPISRGVRISPTHSDILAQTYIPDPLRHIMIEMYER